MLEDLKELQAQIASQEESDRDTSTAISKLDNDINTTRQQIKHNDLYITKMEQDMSRISQSNLEHEHENKDMRERTKILEHELMSIEKELQTKETERAKLSAIIKANSNELSHLTVELDGAKIKLKQAKHQLACLETQCSEKDLSMKALESKLFVNNDSALALSRVDDHTALKRCLISLCDVFLDNKQKPSAENDGCEMLKSLEKKINTIKLTMEQKKRIHAKDMIRLRRESAVLKKVSTLLLGFDLMFCKRLMIHRSSLQELEHSKENQASSEVRLIGDSKPTVLVDKQSSLISDIEMKTLLKKQDSV